MNEIINDKWAAVWPRRWVMVRDAASEEWSGPVQLAFVDSDGDCFGLDSRWYGKGNCRPATPEEIATVEPAASSTEFPDPGPGHRIASGDDWKDNRCEWWRPVSKKWVRRVAPCTQFDRHPESFYRIPIDDTKPNEQIAVKEPKMERYLELKRLAEIAWAAILPEACDADAKPSTVANVAWSYAEFMLIESEQRRPK